MSLKFRCFLAVEIDCSCSIRDKKALEEKAAKKAAEAASGSGASTDNKNKNAAGK